MLNMEYDVQQEEFLNDTLVMAGFDPTEDDFDMLKEDMRPILNESIELNLYKLLNVEEQAEYDVLPDWERLNFLMEKIPDFDKKLADIYINWQNEYLESFNE